MAHIRSEESMVSSETVSRESAAEAPALAAEPGKSWDHGSAPSLPSVDNEGDHVITSISIR